MHNAGQLVCEAHKHFGKKTAISCGEASVNYCELERKVEQTARHLSGLLNKGSRVAVFAEKKIETVVLLFGIWRAGLIAVPVNPVLKAEQVVHILTDSGASLLITTRTRYALLGKSIEDLDHLQTVLFVDGGNAEDSSIRLLTWADLLRESKPRSCSQTIDSDPAAILYTSGSTGRPKGVVLSHRNLIAGASSVVEYLGLKSADVVLSVLPLSFDAGLSQVTTSVLAGAHCDLLNYVYPGPVARRCAEIGVTAITGVPPLWHELASCDWAEGARTLRLFANTGGHMPHELLQKLTTIFPNASPYLMYGLTEAFRSTFLPPEEVGRRPGSIGKAVPNAEVTIINSKGHPCKAWEHGELVHRGGCVTLGYWNRPEENGRRFRTVRSLHPEISAAETAVWSGDIAYADDDGFIYFVGRSDSLIKTSGYRVSPTEIETLVYQTGLVDECIAFGVPHKTKGQVIHVVAALKSEYLYINSSEIAKRIKFKAPSYMVPSHVETVDELPRSENGKIDRKKLFEEARKTVSIGEAYVVQAG